MMLGDALSDLGRQLETLRIRFAVIGGLAASVRGEVRFTRDLDVALAVEDDAQAEQCIYQLRQHGYRVLATVEQETVGRLATARIRHANGAVCDLVFATSGIETEVIESAERLELFPGRSFPTASAESLLGHEDPLGQLGATSRSRRHSKHRPTQSTIDARCTKGRSSPRRSAPRPTR